MEWDNDMHSASVVLKDISVCSLDSQNGGHHMYLITKPVLEKNDVALVTFKELHGLENDASARTSSPLLLSSMSTMPLNSSKLLSILDLSERHLTSC